MINLNNIKDDSNIESAFERLMSTGLSSPLDKVVEFNDEPKIPTYISLPSKRARELYKCYDAFGQGSSFNNNLAKVKAVAEFLERLAAYNPNIKKLIRCDFSEKKCINPSLFVHHKDMQKKQEKDYNINFWSSAFDYISKKRVLVPAQVVYLHNKLSRENGILMEQITTGTALGDGYAMAFHNGLMEVIERDAFMIAYYNKRKIKRVEGFSGIIRSVVDYLNKYQLEVFVFDITNDINIATFMSILVDRSGLGPAISTGLKSGFNYEETIIGSILEAVQPRRYSRLMKEMNKEFKFPEVTDIKSTMDRYYYWYRRESIKYLDFWLKGTARIRYDKLPDYISDLGKFTKTVKKRGYHIFSVDITLNEVRKKNFRVIKVLVPELHPLYISENASANYSMHAGSLNLNNMKPHPFA